MEENDKKIEYITRKDLEEQTQVLLVAFDERFNQLGKELDKRFGEIGINIDKRLNKADEHLDEVGNQLRKDINNVQALIDGYVKAQESFRQEFEIMKVELSQIKKVIKEKLGLEISAI